MKLTLSQYQAQIERLPTYAERKTAVEKAPEHMREQIIAHLRTVRALKGRAQKERPQEVCETPEPLLRVLLNAIVM